jgi:DNA-binding XRE family transcriptional regulator
MKMSQKIRQVSDLLKLPGAFIKVIDEPAFVEDINKLIESYAKKLPIKKIHGVDVDLGRLNDNQYFVKKAYQILTNPNRPMDADSVQWRVFLVQSLEQLLHTQFTNTANFKKKIKAFLEGYEVRKKPPAERIKKARKKMKWTQKQLADHLGYKSHVTIAQHEKGQRAPAKRVFQWLEEVGM